MLGFPNRFSSKDFPDENVGQNAKQCRCITDIAFRTCSSAFCVVVKRSTYVTWRHWQQTYTHVSSGQGQLCRSAGCRFH